MSSFVQLVVKIREIFAQKLVNVDEVMELLESYKSKINEWRRFAIFDMNRYTRNLVDVGNGKYNLMILCWGPGMASSVHDHTDAHCFVKILDGALTETKYHWPRKKHVPLEIYEGNTFDVNGVSYMNDELGLHRMENKSHSNGAVSLHLYIPPYSSCNAFDERSGKKTKCTVTFYSKYGKKLDYRGSKTGN
uniref:Cysteine dioxygenase n=1 Tax=Caenorhabditis japonica TaxID=281687 RepID=A0A8R1DN15_CAEJA